MAGERLEMESVGGGWEVMVVGPLLPAEGGVAVGMPVPHACAQALSALVFAVTRIEEG